MYHIKTDKRSGKSARLICEGLYEILKRKPYAEISISDVCTVNGIARSTFYRLFDTLDDVLLYLFDSLFERTLNESVNSEEPYPQIILRIALSDKTLIGALASSGRMDLFDFATRNREADILNRMQLKLGNVDRVYCTTMLNAMMYSAIKVWIATGCRETSAELYARLKKNLKLICAFM